MKSFSFSHPGTELPFETWSDLAIKMRDEELIGSRDIQRAELFLWLNDMYWWKQSKYFNFFAMQGWNFNGTFLAGDDGFVTYEPFDLREPTNWNWNAIGIKDSTLIPSSTAHFLRVVQMELSEISEQILSISWNKRSELEYEMIAELSTGDRFEESGTTLLEACFRLGRAIAGWLSCVLKPSLLDIPHETIIQDEKFQNEKCVFVNGSIAENIKLMRYVVRDGRNIKRGLGRFDEYQYSLFGKGSFIEGEFWIFISDSLDNNPLANRKISGFSTVQAQVPMRTGAFAIDPKLLAVGNKFKKF